MGSFHKFLGDRRGGTKVFYSGLWENSHHEEFVPCLVFNLANPEGSLISLRVFCILQRGSRSTDVDGSGLYFLLQHLFLLHHVVSFTLRGASVHLYFSGLPIDLQIMVLEPGVAKDHVLLPEVRDGKEHPFRVGFITEDYIHYFGDSSCFVRRAIHVEHQYGARDVLGANTLHTNKVFIYEVACSSEVQKRLDRMHLASVSSTDFYKKDDRCSVSIKGVGRELSG